MSPPTNPPRPPSQQSSLLCSSLCLVTDSTLLFLFPACFISAAQRTLCHRSEAKKKTPVTQISKSKLPLNITLSALQRLWCVTMRTPQSHDLLRQTMNKMDYSSSSLQNSPPQFPLISSPPFTFSRCGQRSAHCATCYCLSNVVRSKHSLSGCLLTFVLISKGSIFPLSALLRSPSLIDISVSALLPLRSGANQCSFFLCYHNFS